MVNSKLKQEQLLSLTELISFNNIDLNFTLKQKKHIRSWIQQSIQKESKKLSFISYNFCSDKYLLKINKKYLSHNDYTDIITFDLCEGKDISGDIYISIERVKENAKTNFTGFHVELCRVLIHGVLHLCGYKDKSDKDAKKMRSKEDFYLALL
jgi:probable rRNA maturation factor